MTRLASGGYPGAVPQPAAATAATAIAPKKHRITDLNQTPAWALPAFLQPTATAARSPTRSARASATARTLSPAASRRRISASRPGRFSGAPVGSLRAALGGRRGRRRRHPRHRPPQQDEPGGRTSDVRYLKNGAARAVRALRAAIAPAPADGVDPSLRAAGCARALGLDPATTPVGITCCCSDFRLGSSTASRRREPRIRDRR